MVEKEVQESPTNTVTFQEPTDSKKPAKKVAMKKKTAPVRKPVPKKTTAKKTTTKSPVRATRFIAKHVDSSWKVYDRKKKEFSQHEFNNQEMARNLAKIMQEHADSLSR